MSKQKNNIIFLAIIVAFFFNLILINPVSAVFANCCYCSNTYVNYNVYGTAPQYSKECSPPGATSEKIGIDEKNCRDNYVSSVADLLSPGNDVLNRQCAWFKEENKLPKMSFQVVAETNGCFCAFVDSPNIEVYLAAQIGVDIKSKEECKAKTEGSGSFACKWYVDGNATDTYIPLNGCICTDKKGNKVVSATGCSDEGVKEFQQCSNYKNGTIIKTWSGASVKNGCRCEAAGTIWNEQTASGISTSANCEEESDQRVSGGGSYEKKYCAWYVSGNALSVYTMGKTWETPSNQILDMEPYSGLDGCYCIKSGEVSKNKDDSILNIDDCKEKSTSVGSCYWYDINKQMGYWEGGQLIDKKCVLKDPTEIAKYCGEGSKASSECNNKAPYCKIEKIKKETMGQYQGLPAEQYNVEYVDYCLPNQMEMCKQCGTLSLDKCDSSPFCEVGKPGSDSICGQYTATEPVPEEAREEYKGVPWEIPPTEDLNKLGSTDISTIIGRVIKAIMGIMGSIALAMFVYSGILWMTAAGNSEKEEKSKLILVWSTLGVVVVFASYALLNFVFEIIG